MMSLAARLAEQTADSLDLSNLKLSALAAAEWDELCLFVETRPGLHHFNFTSCHLSHCEPAHLRRLFEAIGQDGRERRSLELSNNDLGDEDHEPQLTAICEGLGASPVTEALHLDVNAWHAMTVNTVNLLVGLLERTSPVTLHFSGGIQITSPDTTARIYSTITTLPRLTALHLSAGFGEHAGVCQRVLPLFGENFFARVTELYLSGTGFDQLFSTDAYLDTSGAVPAGSALGKDMRSIAAFGHRMASSASLKKLTLWDTGLFWYVKDGGLPGMSDLLLHDWLTTLESRSTDNYEHLRLHFADTKHLLELGPSVTTWLSRSAHIRASEVVSRQNLYGDTERAVAAAINANPHCTDTIVLPAAADTLAPEALEIKEADTESGTTTEATAPVPAPLPTG